MIHLISFRRKKGALLKLRGLDGNGGNVTGGNAGNVTFVTGVTYSTNMGHDDIGGNEGNVTVGIEGDVTVGNEGNVTGVSS